jgi:hypothetical protein
MDGLKSDLSLSKIPSGHFVCKSFSRTAVNLGSPTPFYPDWSTTCPDVQDVKTHTDSAGPVLPCSCLTLEEMGAHVIPMSCN